MVSVSVIDLLHERNAMLTLNGGSGKRSRESKMGFWDYTPGWQTAELSATFHVISPDGYN